MEINAWIFLSQCVIFYTQFEVITAKPIIGANVRQARSGEYSFIASIMRIQHGHPHSNGEHFCTGTIISKQDILTSAHCLEDEELNEVQLVIGTIDLRNGTVFYPLWWQTYNQFAQTLNITVTYRHNDMANIRIILEVPDHIRVARLSGLSNIELYNADVVMAGWGINSQGITPDIMNVANLKIVHNQICADMVSREVGRRLIIEIQLLCTFVTPFILMQDGDSGGPLLFHNKLIAINRGTCPMVPNTSNGTQVNLHLGVHYYREFINFIKSG